MMTKDDQKRFEKLLSKSMYLQATVGTWQAPFLIIINNNQKQPVCGHWNTPAHRHSLLVFHSLWSFSSEFQISAPKSDYNCCCRGKDRFVKSIISLKDKGKLSWCSARDIMDKTIEELQVLSYGAILVLP